MWGDFPWIQKLIPTARNDYRCLEMKKGNEREEPSSALDNNPLYCEPQGKAFSMQKRATKKRKPNFETSRTSKPSGKVLNHAQEHKVDVFQDLRATGFALPYDHPTPIQAQSIPVALHGASILGVAPTGSGKTLAYVLPLLAKAREGYSSIVLFPTRLLALQSLDVCKQISFHQEKQSNNTMSFTNISKSALQKENILTFCCVGNLSDQRDGDVSLVTFLEQNLVQEGRVLFTTPGAVLSRLKSKAPTRLSLRKFLNSAVQIVVLDEVDRLFDIGTRKRVFHILSQVLLLNQVLAFSATCSKEIKDVIQNSFPLAVFHIVTVGPNSVPCSNVKQSFTFVSSMVHKQIFLRNYVKYILENEETAQILVFCGSKSNTRNLYNFLARELPQYASQCTTLSSDLSQCEREKRMEDLRQTKKLRVVLGTDMVARGLDIPLVDYIVNFEFPRNLVDYVHRAGRTGRAGQTGYLHTLIRDREKPFVPALCDMLERQGIEIPRDLLFYRNTGK